MVDEDFLLWTVQYNGCKWKGGVLRVEKAKEHYMDRLRREWAEAEAEAAVKAKIAEKAAANAITQPRHMYSSQYEDVSEATGLNWKTLPGSNRVELEDDIGEEGWTVLSTFHHVETPLIF